MHTHPLTAIHTPGSTDVTTHTHRPPERQLLQTLRCSHPEKVREVGVSGESTGPRARTMAKARVEVCPSPSFSISGALRSP